MRYPASTEHFAPGKKPAAQWPGKNRRQPGKKWRKKQRQLAKRGKLWCGWSTICNEKNGRAAVREKWRTAGIKSEGKPPSTLEAGETGVCLERDAPRKNSLAAAVEEMVRKASEKKTALAER